MISLKSLTRLVQRTSLSHQPHLVAPLLPVRRPASLPFPSPAASACRAYATQPAHLGNLSPALGSSHKRKRIGRGIGSGKGGTSGRGNKGQGARSGNGKPKLYFAGGQTPITRAFPKRGFTNPLREEMAPLNLDRLQHWIDRGLIDPTKPITLKELFETRCVHGIKHGVKLLSDGAESFTTPNLNITVCRASQSAIAAIEGLSGTIVARYENRLTLRALINPTSFARRGHNLPNKADPVSRRDLLYYSDPKHRGYLAKAKVVPSSVGAVQEEVAPSAL